MVQREAPNLVPIIYFGEEPLVTPSALYSKNLNLDLEVMMSSSISKTRSSSSSEDEAGGLRRGPWTPEEDNLLIHHISSHGEGRWNLLANRSGLKRTGKSCRLRWLNYLKPDLKRGNLTTEEQLLILKLHSKWGNRWSKIAQHLPGRTDNEIKNYWRTRVQKQARHLKIDTNSPQFQEIIRHIWIPRLLQKIQDPSGSSDSFLQNSANYDPSSQTPLAITDQFSSAPSYSTQEHQNLFNNQLLTAFKNSSNSSISSLESANMGCHFYYSGCQNERGFLNLGSAEAVASDHVFTGENNWLWDDYRAWNMDEFLNSMVPCTTKQHGKCHES